MEDKTSPSCGCDDNCCQPPRKKPWMNLLFIVIVVAALAIVAIKVFSPDTTGAQSATVSTAKHSCCDPAKQDSCMRTCDSATRAACCPKAK